MSTSEEIANSAAAAIAAISLEEGEEEKIFHDTHCFSGVKRDDLADSYARITNDGFDDEAMAVLGPVVVSTRLPPVGENDYRTFTTDKNEKHESQEESIHITLVRQTLARIKAFRDAGEKKEEK